MMSKNLMTEEDIKLQYITPALTKKWNIRKISMEAKVTDGKVNLKGNLISRGAPKRADYLLHISDNNPIAVACLVKNIRFNLILSDKSLRINMTNDYIYKEYIIMVLNSPQIRQLIIELMSGMDKQQVNISQDKYKTLLIPTPPLAEQKRIVAKLEEILPL